MRLPIPAILFVAATLISCARGTTGTGSPEQHVLHTFDTVRLTDEFYAEGANAADINADGEQDIVSGPFWYEGPDFTDRFRYREGETFDIEGYSDHFFPYGLDMDSDDDIDIFVIGFPGQDASWWENPGSDQATSPDWTRHVVLEEVSNESPFFGDIVGDERPELVCINGNRYGYALPDWDSPAAPWRFVPVSAAKEEWQRFTHGMGVGDINGDGRMDVIHAGGWFEQPSSVDGEPMWTHHDVDFGPGGAQMYAYDFDGDGSNEVATSLEAHGWGIAVFSQGASGWERQLIMGPEKSDSPYGVRFSQPHAVALVDMNRDGVLDILSGKRVWAHGYKGDPEPAAPPVVYWFETVRSEEGLSFVPHLIDDASGVGVGVVATDLDGDGYPEVIVGNKTGLYVTQHMVKEVSAEEWETVRPRLVDR